MRSIQKIPEGFISNEMEELASEETLDQRTLLKFLLSRCNGEVKRGSLEEF
jgi:hypothetical protein